jgi:hypothetical protein
MLTARDRASLKRWSERMSVRTLVIGGVGLVAAISGAAFVVRANSGDVVEFPSISSVTVPAGDLLTQSAPPPTIKRPRVAVPASPAHEPERDPFTSGPDFRPGDPLSRTPPRPDPLDPFGAAPATPAAPLVEPPVDASLVDPAPLRAELRELLNEKLELLTVPQLQAAIIRTETEIRELKAQDRLEQLRHDLETLSREYPQTWGGNAAQKMINVPLPTVPAETRPASNPFDSSLEPSFAPPSPTPAARHRT